jgi:hypothetical protein
MSKHSSHPSVAFDSVHRILQEQLNVLGISEQMLESRIKDHWDEMVGERISEVARPHRMESGELFIRVETKTWLQELQYFQQRYRKRLNLRLGARCIRKLTFELGPLPPPTADAPAEEAAAFQPNSGNDWEQINLGEQTVRHIEQQLQHLNEGPLKDSARRIMIKHEKLTRMRNRSKRPRR